MPNHKTNKTGNGVIPLEKIAAVPTAQHPKALRDDSITSYLSFQVLREQKELLETYLDAQSDIEEVSRCGLFTAALKFGALLMIEVFQTEE